MKLDDFKLLKKLLNMTLSGADQERLVAIDKANEIVRKSNTTWDKILDRVIKVELEIESFETSRTTVPDRAARGREIEEAFATIIDSDPRGDYAELIADLKSQWDRNGRLSTAQAEAVLKGARRVEERQGGRRI